MKRIVLIVILLCRSVWSDAQDSFDRLMTLREIDCADVALNAPHLIKGLLEQNKMDSSYRFLAYWKSKCGDNEPIFRINILLALVERNFNDTLLNSNSVEHLHNYKMRRELIRSANYTAFDYYKTYFNFIQPGGEFDQLTQQIADDVKNTYPENSVERLLASCYADEDQSFFSSLQSDVYKGTVLQNRYNTEVDKYLNYLELHVGFLAGIWIPTGDITQLGNHPDMGFQCGYKKKRWNYDLTVTLKWGDTPKPYWANRPLTTGTRELTSEFFGGYIGFDVGWDLLRDKQHEFQLLAGVGYDGFDVFKQADPNDPVESVSSYNFNFGIAYRYYFENDIYVGLRGKYNIVDYTLTDVIDFTGNPVTVHLAIGGLTNIFRRNALKELDYNGRR